MVLPNNMIYQNDPKLPDVFRREGCRVRCLMATAEIDQDKAMTPLQIELCLATSEKDPTVVLPQDMEAGKNEHKISLYAFKLISGLPWFCRQIGEKRDDGFFDWDGKPLPQSRIGFTILHWETDYPAGHFTLGDQVGAEIWDPWCPDAGFNPWDSSGKTGYRIHKRRVVATYAYGLFKEQNA